MSGKVELTIQIPSLNLRDADGQVWQPFDLTEAFHRGERGLQCRVCRHDTWKGWSRQINREDQGYEFICPSCVALINPWEATP